MVSEEEEIQAHFEVHFVATCEWKLTKSSTRIYTHHHQQQQEDGRRLLLLPYNNNNNNNARRFSFLDCDVLSWENTGILTSGFYSERMDTFPNSQKNRKAWHDRRVFRAIPRSSSNAPTRQKWTPAARCWNEKKQFRSSKSVVVDCERNVLREVSFRKRIEDTKKKKKKMMIMMMMI